MKKLIRKIIKITFQPFDRLIILFLKLIKAVFIPPVKRDEKPYLMIDCSFISTTDLNTGIQRVVRNILANINVPAKACGMNVICVSISDGITHIIDINKRHGQNEINVSTRTEWIMYKIKTRLIVYKSIFEKKLDYRKGDVILMLDSTWHMNVWPSIHEMRKSGVQVIGVTYDLIPINTPHLCDETLVSIFTSWFAKSTMYFDGYISISKTVMNTVINYIEQQGLDVSSYRFDYFKMGADFKLTTQAQAMAPDDIAGIFSDHSTYLTVSTIEPRKNHVFILDEMEKLWDAGIDVRWVIVGRIGWKTDELIERIKNHKEYCRRLFMFNNMDDAGLAYCYTHAKALIFASIIEGYGLPVVESLKMGLPVLASDTEIHREVGGENAVYFSIEKPGTLSSLVADIENGKHELKHINTDRIHITTWKESAEDLVTKIKKMAKYEK